MRILQPKKHKFLIFLVKNVSMNENTVQNKSMLPGKSLEINKRASMFIPHSRVARKHQLRGCIPDLLTYTATQDLLWGGDET